MEIAFLIKSVCLMFQRMTYLQVWWDIICLLQVCEWFFVSDWNSYTTAGVHVLRKSSSREFEVQKSYSKIFRFPNISRSMHIFFFSSQQPLRGFFGKCCSLKYLFSFADAFFPQCLRKMFYSNCTFTVCNFPKSWST